MSSAPPGWHRQPDGRDRYWDGERWTDDFRDPTDATTQQIPVDETRGMPSTQDQGGYATSRPTAGSPGGPGAYPPPQQGPGGYGPPPPAYGGPLSDQRGSGGGWLKGCLIALLVGIVLIALLAVAGIWLFRSASDRVSESIETILPTELATELPTDLPSEFPTDLPSDLPTDLPTGLPTDLPSLPEGEVTDAALGDEFTLGPVTVQSGWTVDEVALGFAAVTMSAVSSESGSVPLIFDLVFFEGDTDTTRTTCTVPLEPVGEPVDVACVPVRGYTDGVDRVQAIELRTG